MVEPMDTFPFTMPLLDDTALVPFEFTLNTFAMVVSDVLPGNRAILCSSDNVYDCSPSDGHIRDSHYC